MVVSVARDAASQGRFSTVNPQPSTPTSIKTDVLSKAYDIDGNGHISTTELVKSAELAIKTRKWNRLLWKGLGLAIFVVMALIGINAGLTYGIVDANKDTEVKDRSLMVKAVDGVAEVPVATSNNEITVVFAAIPFLPSRLWRTSTRCRSRPRTAWRITTRPSSRSL